MTMPEGYVRVSRRLRCPICGKPDWCLVSRDGKFAMCPRSPNSYETPAGFRHALTGEAQAEVAVIAARALPEPPEATIDAAALAVEFQDNVSETALEGHAATLGVSVEALTVLGIGYSPQSDAWTFPMRNGSGKIVGVRLRNEAGRKWAVRGSTNGLFFSPTHLLGSKTLLLAEGPTDTAAAIDLGFHAVGRHTARGGAGLVLELLNVFRPSLVVVVGDVDAPDKMGHQAGIEGACNLADQIWSLTWTTKVIFPRRGKDLRKWKQLGATKAELNAVISNSPPWSKRDR